MVGRSRIWGARKRGYGLIQANRLSAAVVDFGRWYVCRAAPPVYLSISAGYGLPCSASRFTLGGFLSEKRRTSHACSSVDPSLIVHHPSVTYAVNVIVSRKECRIHTLSLQTTDEKWHNNGSSNSGFSDQLEWPSWSFARCNFFKCELLLS